MKSLAVIIPVFNRATLVERALDSVYAQTWRPLELVVVDNGSTDDSLQVVRQWADGRRRPDFSVSVVSEPRRGASAARRTGTLHARSPYLAFLDSDDAWRPAMAREAMSAFEASPEANLVYWRKIMHTVEGNAFMQRFSRRDPLSFHVFHSLFSTEGYAVEREFFLSTGGWNPEVHEWDDWELGIRLASSPELRAVGLDSVLVDSYARRDSLTGVAFSHKAGVWERAIAAAVEYAATLPPLSCCRLMRLLAFKQAILGASYRREGRPDLGREALTEARRMLPAGSRRGVLRLAYVYASLGLRGAASIFPRFL